jgi:hypothetical protein
MIWPHRSKILTIVADSRFVGNFFLFPTLNAFKWKVPGFAAEFNEKLIKSPQTDFLSDRTK